MNSFKSIAIVIFFITYTCDEYNMQYSEQHHLDLCLSTIQSIFISCLNILELINTQVWLVETFQNILLQLISNAFIKVALRFSSKLKEYRESLDIRLFELSQHNNQLSQKCLRHTIILSYKLVEPAATKRFFLQ